MRLLTIRLGEGEDSVEIRIPIEWNKKDIGKFLESTYQRLSRDLEKIQWRKEISSPIKGKN